MTRKKPIFYLLLILIGCNNLLAQNKNQDFLSHAIDSLMLVLKTNKEDSSKVKTLLDIAWKKFNLTWSRGGDYESAIQYANQGLALANKVNFKWGKGRANFVLGMCWNAKADFTEALKYHFAALKISFENKNKILTINEYYHIGKAYNRLGNYKEALKNYSEELKVIKEINADDYYPDCYAGIGNVLLNMKNYTEADKYFAEAYSLAEKSQSKFLMGEMLHYMGSSLLAQKKYDDALSKYSSALTIFRDLPSKSRLGFIYNGIANILCKKASIERDSIVRLQYYSDAIPYFHKSLALDREIGFKDAVISNYSGLAEAYRGINDYKNALSYTDLFSKSQDSSYSKIAYLKIADLQFKYQTEKAAAEMKAQREKEKIKEEALRSKLLADQKLQQQQIQADERIAHEKEIAEEKVKSEKSIHQEKVKQEKIKAEKQQMNNLLLMGLSLAMMASVFLFFYLRQRNEKKRAVEKAETIHKMAELELQSLRAQLNPHFMFNSLNSIQELILLEENDKSHIYLSRFSKLLRMLLENAEKPFIPLQKEIDFLRLYLDLENLRVPDLQYSISTDPAFNTEQTLIPNLILQPYIENAIWHGLAHKVNDKQLKIRIYRKNGTVHYEIEDNGVGRKKSLELKSLFRKNHISKGMELLTKRFRLLNEEYSTNIHISITDVMNNDDIAGTLVCIKVPANFQTYFQN